MCTLPTPESPHASQRPTLPPLEALKILTSFLDIQFCLFRIACHRVVQHTAFQSLPPFAQRHAPKSSVLPHVSALASFQLLCGHAFRDWCLRLIIHSSVQAHLGCFQGFKMSFFVCEHSFHFSRVNIQEQNDKDTGY